MYGFYSPPHTQRWFSPPPMSALGSPTTTIVSPSRSRDSISTQSTSTSTESEEVNIITTDPKFSEHSHPFQSQVRVTDDVPVVHVSPYGGALPMYSPTNLCFPHPIPKAKVKLPSKRKVLKYKSMFFIFVFNSERGTNRIYSQAMQVLYSRERMPERPVMHIVCLAALLFYLTCS